MKLKKLLVIFLCFSLLINTSSVGFAFNEAKCQTKTNIDLSCIENLMDEQLKSRKNDLLIKNVSFPNGSSETLVHSSLSPRALQQLIKYLTPSKTQKEFNKELKEIMKFEDKKSSRQNVILAIISSISALLVSAYSSLKLNKINKEKSSNQVPKAKGEKKEEKNSNVDLLNKNKNSKKNNFINTAVSLLLGVDVALFLFITLHFITDILNPSQVPNTKEFNSEYNAKVEALNYILNALSYSKGYDSINIAFKALGTSNADIKGFKTQNIGLNYSTEESKEIQKNIEIVKKQLKEIIKKYNEN